MVNWREPIEEGEVGIDAIVVEDLSGAAPDRADPGAGREGRGEGEPLPEQQSEATPPPKPEPLPEPPREEAPAVAPLLVQARAALVIRRLQIATLLERKKRCPRKPGRAASRA